MYLLTARAIWTIEANELKDESYGVDLLNVVGATYLAKARHHQAATGTPFGIGGWFHSARSTAHVLGESKLLAEPGLVENKPKSHFFP